MNSTGISTTVQFLSMNFEVIMETPETDGPEHMSVWRPSGGFLGTWSPSPRVGWILVGGNRQCSDIEWTVLNAIWMAFHEINS